MLIAYFPGSLLGVEEQETRNIIDKEKMMANLFINLEIGCQ
jgi:hypothetical protein